MSLRSDFENAWNAGKDPDSLLELVHQHQACGVTAQEAYQILQHLWLDCGYDETELPDSMQDNLEYVLEKLWYESPAVK